MTEDEFNILQREFSSKAQKRLRKLADDLGGAGVINNKIGGDLHIGTGSHGQTEFEIFKDGKKITGTGEFGAFGDQSRNIQAQRKAYRMDTSDVLEQRLKAKQQGGTFDLKRQMENNLSDKNKEILRQRREARAKIQTNPQTVGSSPQIAAGSKKITTPKTLIHTPASPEVIRAAEHLNKQARSESERLTGLAIERANNRSVGRKILDKVKNNKTKIAGGVAMGGLLAYGAKKIYDRNKKEI